LLLFVDDYFKRNERNDQSTESISYFTAFKIGCFQVLSMVFPGLSRSAATIVGGLSQGLNRQRAAEFAFFLAVPTMLAASLKDGYEYYKGIKAHTIMPLSGEQIGILVVGNIVAFIVAMLAIQTFIGYLNRHGFKIFGYYRIAIGLLILILQAAGFQLFVH
jgi:undecaprenyl-diphosphatase